jgi:hypothetical protein
MSTLNMPRSLTDLTNPTEAQLDTMRTALLNFFNTTKMTEANLAAGGLDWSLLGGTLGNDVPLAFTSNHYITQYNTSTGVFELTNTQGDIGWNHKLTSTTSEDFLRLRNQDGLLISEGLVSCNTTVGRNDVDINWLMARYRKPRLLYTDDNIVTLEANGTSATDSMLLFHDRLATCSDRTLNLNDDANGETVADVGASLSGRRAGLARANNTWYYIYAVIVQYGADNDGTKFILCADTTSPLAANIATLNTRYGTNKWVYMGLVRNGYNTTGGGAKIVFFIQNENRTQFTTSWVSGEPAGVMLATADASAVNLDYTLAFGTGAAQIPDVCTRAVFGGYRSTHGFEFCYTDTGSGEEQARVTTLYHVDSLSTMVGALYLDVPLISGYKCSVHVATAVNNQRITCVAVVDGYV